MSVDRPNPQPSSALFIPNRPVHKGLPTGPTGRSLRAFLKLGVVVWQALCMTNSVCP